MFSRRDFLKQSLATWGLVAYGLSAPRFLAKTAAAAPSSDKPGAKDTILVVVEMNGGNDGLNTVIPFADERYYQYRPTLKVPKDQVKKINDQLGLHPNMSAFSSLLEDNSLCVLQGVGYPGPNESHFHSMNIWHSAALGNDPQEGWLGKTLHRLPHRVDAAGLRSSPTLAFQVSGGNEGASLALAGAPAKVPLITTLQDFQPRTGAASMMDGKRQQEVIERAAGASAKPAAANLIDFVQRTAVNTYATSRRLKEIAKEYQPKVPYPTSGLANRLKLAAQLINADLGARIFYVTIDGFDTHANQLSDHPRLVQEVSEAMAAFFKDMTARGHRDRIMMMTFSEFGRRAKENGSKGTDHGAGAPMFLVGGKVQPGLVGAHPKLDDLDANGNLKFHTDFRQVYATVLDQWLGVPSKGILGAEFKPVAVMRS